MTMHQPDHGQHYASSKPVHGTHTVIVTRWRWDRITILGAVLAVVVTGGIYLVTGSGGETEIGSDGVPLILADPTPTRTRPEQPGGMPIANENRLILSTDRPAEPPIEVHEILPPPEAPVWPLPAQAAAPGETQASQGRQGDYEAVAVDGGLEAILPSSEEEGIEPASQSAIIASAETVEGGQPTDQVDTTANLSDLIERSDDTATDAQAAVVANEAAAAALEPAAPAPVFAPVENGVWRVQLATVLKPEDAPAEWSRILNRNPDLLGALSPTVIEKERDGRKLYGVQAAPLDETGARGLCEALKSRSTDCLVVGP